MRRQQSFKWSEDLSRLNICCVHANSLRCLKAGFARVKASQYPVAKWTAKDARGNIVGTTEEWLSRDDITVALYLRSTQYYVLLQQYTRPVNHYP